MGCTKIIVGLFILFASFLAPAAEAQMAILFQVPGSEMQIAAAEKIGDQEAVQEYKRSDLQIKNAIFKDFRENYQSTDVYFFLPADYEKVKNKEFAAVVFYDNKGQKITMPQITNYYIANISFFPKEYFTTVKNGQEILEETAESHTGLGIILRDKNYKPVTGKMRFTPCKIFKRGPIWNKKKRYYVFSGSEQFSAKVQNLVAPSKSPQ